MKELSGVVLHIAIAISAFLIVFLIGGLWALMGFGLGFLVGHWLKVDDG